MGVTTDPSASRLSYWPKQWLEDNRASGSQTSVVRFEGVDPEVFERVNQSGIRESVFPSPYKAWDNMEDVSRDWEVVDLADPIGDKDHLLEVLRDNKWKGIWIMKP